MSDTRPQSSTGIVERLRFDAARCELQFSKGIADNIEEGIAEIERLTEQVRNRDCTIDHLGELKDAEIKRLRARIADLEEQILRALGERPRKALEGK